MVGAISEDDPQREADDLLPAECQSSSLQSRKGGGANLISVSCEDNGGGPIACMKYDTQIDEK